MRFRDERRCKVSDESIQPKPPVIEAAARDSWWQRAIVISIQSLIILSMVTFSLETLPNLSTASRTWLRRIETVIVVIFTIEYCVRLATAKRRWAYALSLYGMIDLIAILPFYLSLGVDLRSLRVIRVFRLFRVFKLLRYSRAIQRFHQALLIAREELVLYLIVTLMMLYFAAVGIYYCEHEAQPEAFASIFHSLWWGVATLTTVGYGDIYPITAGGKIFTFVILLCGLGVVSVPTGIISSALSKARDLEQ